MLHGLKIDYVATIYLIHQEAGDRKKEKTHMQSECAQEKTVSLAKTNSIKGPAQVATHPSTCITTSTVAIAIVQVI